MNNRNDILELKFEGGGIKPSAVRASEVAELISSFEKAIIITLQDRYPDIDTHQYAYLSITNIEDQSLGLKFLAEKATEAFLSTFFLLTTSINKNAYNEIPSPAVENLKNISRFTKKHNCDCNYIHQGLNLAKFTPETIVEVSELNTIKGETILYGKLQRVGGEVPRVVFKDHTGQNIYFEVTEDVAKQLAPKLYEEIALTGTARWDKKTFKVLDFKVSGITDLESRSLTKTFSEISSVIGKYWNEVDDIESVIN